MGVVILIVFVWAVCALFKRQRQRKPARIPPAPPPVVTVYDAKQAERERKAEAKRREIAQVVYYDRDNLNLLYPLLDAAKAAYKDAAGEKTREKYARKIISLRKQIASTEARIEKAKYTLSF